MKKCQEVIEKMDSYWKQCWYWIK